MHEERNRLANDQAMAMGPKIRRYRDAGYSYRQIAALLTELGVPTSALRLEKTTDWTGSQVKRRLDRYLQLTTLDH